GIGSSIRDGALKSFANVFALLLTAGFITLPVSVMTGVVS
ncbi:succinate dehydrogenase, partial [Streptomyces chiangmaiensis]|nr:succinate dehydrogenase [Streptomyces chiangmaiensis]